MNVKTIMYISKMLDEKYEDLNAQCDEIEECLNDYDSAAPEVRGDAKNDKAYEELRKKLDKAIRSRDQLGGIRADFARTDWH